MDILEPRELLDEVKNQTLSSFIYLKKANDCLSSQKHESTGRDMLIRALESQEIFQKHETLFKELLRKAGLFPYIKKYFSNLAPEQQFLLDVHRSNFDDEFIFHAMQAHIFQLLISGKDIVLSAPTSMGKSVIVDALIADGKFKSIVIVVPTIALIDETRRRIQRRFSSEYQIIYHGSQVRRKDKVIYIFTQERVNERDDLKNIDLFIIDEFYKLAYTKDELSKPRVIALNIALSKLLTISKQFYMIGPYIDAIQGLSILKRGYQFIPSEFNTVSLNIHKYNLAHKDNDAKQHQLKSIIENYPGQTIIYCKSSNSIGNVIRFLDSLDDVQKNKFKDLDLLLLRKYYKWLVKNYGKDWGCTKALTNGIGIHHGALPRAIQQKTIDLFNSGHLRFLLCTSTMIEGVNTAAENIVIYDNRNGNPKIDNFTHKNISGRAGRMGQYLVGNVFCLEEIPEKQSQVVDLPLGQQDEDSPINLLAGIQPDHLSNQSSLTLNEYTKDSDVPIEIIRKHSSYKVEVIAEAYELITELSVDEMKQIATLVKPKKYQLSLLTKFIKMVESTVLARQQLHFEDSDDLQNRLSNYIYADTFSDYIKKQIKKVYDSREDTWLRSEGIDKELYITRNIFKHAVPRALALLEDLLNYEFKQLGLPQEANLGYLLHIFENSHLPAAFSALEETGIPIETLEKLSSDHLQSASLDALTRYLRLYYKQLKGLTDLDRDFIERALS